MLLSSFITGYGDDNGRGGKGMVVAEGKIVGMLMADTGGERWGEASARWEEVGRQERGRGDGGGFGRWDDEGGRRIDGWNRWRSGRWNERKDEKTMTRKRLTLISFSIAVWSTANERL